MVEVTGFKENFGLVVQAADANVNINDIDISDYLIRFKSPEGGVVLFRGFHPSIDDFKTFTETHGKHFRTSLTNTADRASVRADDTIVTVNLGHYAINFHAEITVPYTPEVLWMYCSKPASSRGRTGVVDGAKVYQELMPFTRDIFHANGGFVHFEHLPKEAWSQLYPGKNGAQLAQFLASLPDVVDVSVNEQETLSFKFKETPIKKGKFTQQDVFCCGLLDYPDQILTRDKKQYTPGVISEVTQAVYKHAAWVEWQAGDILMVDNSRVMHAREAFECPQRSIFIRYSDLADSGVQDALISAENHTENHDENALII